MILKQEMYYGAIVGHKRQGIGVGCKHTVSVPKEEQFIVEGRHEGIITKEDFLKAQEIFYEIGETKNVIQKTYSLYRKVKCGICGRAMSYKAYSRNGVTYRYFTCPHAKEQTGEDGCCKRYVIEESGSCKMAYKGSTGQRCLATGRCHFDRENSKEHGELIFDIIFRGIAMIYTVKASFE